MNTLKNYSTIIAIGLGYLLTVILLIIGVIYTFTRLQGENFVYNATVEVIEKNTTVNYFGDTEYNLVFRDLDTEIINTEGVSIDTYYKTEIRDIIELNYIGKVK